MANEIQTVSFSPAPTAGTFTLSFNGLATAALDYDTAASDIQTALEGLAGIGTGNIGVVGTADTGEIALAFQGALLNTNVAQTTCDASGLSGQGTIGPATEMALGTIGQDMIYYIQWPSDGDGGTFSSVAFNIDGSGVEFGVFSASPDVASALSEAGFSNINVAGETGGFSLDFTDTAAHSVSPNDAYGIVTETQANIPGTAEVQAIPQPSAIDGTFAVTGAAEATSALAYNIGVADMQTALNGLSDIAAAGGVTVGGTDGGPWNVTWNSLGPRSLLTVDGSDLTQPSLADAETTTQGGNPAGGVFWSPIIRSARGAA